MGGKPRLLWEHVRLEMPERHGCKRKKKIKQNLQIWLSGARSEVTHPRVQKEILSKAREEKEQGANAN